MEQHVVSEPKVTRTLKVAQVISDVPDIIWMVLGFAGGFYLGMKLTLWYALLAAGLFGLSLGGMVDLARHHVHAHKVDTLRYAKQQRAADCAVNITSQS